MVDSIVFEFFLYSGFESGVFSLLGFVCGFGYLCFAVWVVLCWLLGWFRFGLILSGAYSCCVRVVSTYLCIFKVYNYYFDY